MSAEIDGSSQAAAPPAQEPGSFQRIAGVFMAPTETFESVARKPDTTVPLIVQLVIALIIGIIFATHVDFGAPAREQAEEQGRSAAQAEQAAKFGGMIGKGIAYSSPIWTAVYFLVLAGIFHLAFRMFGGNQDYTRAFSATLYAGFINALQSLIMALVILLRGGPLGPQDLPTVLRSNLGFLVDMKAHPVLFSLATNFDAFTIWYAIVLVIALACISRLPRARAAGIVIGLYVIKILGGAGFAWIGAMMRARAAAG